MCETWMCTYHCLTSLSSWLSKLGHYRGEILGYSGFGTLNSQNISCYLVFVVKRLYELSIQNKIRILLIRTERNILFFIFRNKLKLKYWSSVKPILKPWTLVMATGREHANTLPLITHLWKAFKYLKPYKYTVLK